MRHIALGSLVLPFAFVLAGCGGAAAGTQPHDMSQAQHEAAASSEEKQAEPHAAQYDPNATETTEKCAAGRGRVCWSETANPTAAHGKEAADHRALAAKHRAASKALQDAEAQACSGISEEDRDESPFAHVADIASVSTSRTRSRPARARRNRTPARR